MIIMLPEVPQEGSTIVITVEFLDEEGTAYIPKSCFWTLTDKLGNIINGKDRVIALVTATSHKFVIYGDDLLCVDTKYRLFTIEGVYDSINGYDLPYRQDASFTIADMVVNPL